MLVIYILSVIIDLMFISWKLNSLLEISGLELIVILMPGINSILASIITFGALLVVIAKFFL